MERKKKWRKIKNIHEVNKLLLYGSSNSFHLFFLFYIKIKQFENA